jgi:hypothetical protein
MRECSDAAERNRESVGTEQRVEPAWCVVPYRLAGTS